MAAGPWVGLERVVTGTAERVFLGWDGPVLPRAARWLVERFGRDLGTVTVALPGRFGVRRLGEQLALLPGEPVVPPRLVTAGRLTDVLLGAGQVFAPRAVRTLLWSRVLHEAQTETPATMAALLATPPGAAAPEDWTALAEPLRALHGELGLAGLDAADVLAALGTEESPRHERARWAVLVELQRRYRVLLEGTDVVDPHDGRRDALAKGRVAAPGPVVLVGVSEASPLLRRALEGLAEAPTALVVAPDGEAGHFDALGCVIPGDWSGREIPLGDEQWSVVDRPLDQGREVARLLAGFDGRFAAEQITIGLPDEEVGPFVERQLTAHGLAGRPSRGRAWRRTSIGRLLEATADYLSGRTFAALAALARHDLLETALASRRGHTGPGSRTPEAGAATGAESGIDTETPAFPRPLAESLDRFHADHLPSRADAPPLVAPGARGLARLLGDLGQSGRRPLSEWAGPIGTYVGRVLGERPLDTEASADAELIGAIRVLRDGLAELVELPAAADLAVDGANAVRLVIEAQREATVAPPSDGAAIEMMGWLELPFDDAPALIVTGFQQGRVPATRREHAFLPEALREVLGMPGDDERLARDVHALTVLLHAREAVHLVCGRRSRVNDPLHPSRLLFHGPDELIAERVQRVVAGAGEEPTLAPQDTRAAVRSLPRHPSPPALERMSVTAFGAWLRSPYDFYLKRLLRLDVLDDVARELDGRSFGSLAHDVLELFGRDETAAGSRSSDAIAARLDELLDDVVAERFGRSPLPAVVLQVERLRLRLHRFARWQAGRAAAGWEILAVEWAPEGGTVPFDVDGTPIALSGKIDRIDRHTEHGWEILDYKTGERASNPARTHGPVDGDWKDLQLPLYRVLAADLAAEHGLPGVPRLAYVNLGKETDNDVHAPADWTAAQLEEAVEAAREVVRRIRAGELFDAGDFPAFDEIPTALAGLGLRGTGDEEPLDGDEVSS